MRQCGLEIQCVGAAGRRSEWAEVDVNQETCALTKQLVNVC